MPADEENAKYLYLVLTAAGPSSIDWAAVAKDLDLKPGATSKRWSRLKQAMNENKPPGPTAYQFLWLCIKHCKEGKAPDWKFIAEKCDTTVGAASKRYSRLKIAMEKGEAMPTVNVPAKDKGKPKTDAGDGKEYEAPAADGQAKRKRAPPKKGRLASDKAEVKDEKQVSDSAEGDAEKKPAPKRARTAKGKSVPKKELVGDDTGKDEVEKKPAPKRTRAPKGKAAAAKKKREKSANEETMDGVDSDRSYGGEFSY